MPLIRRRSGVLHIMQEIQCKHQVHKSLSKKASIPFDIWVKMNNKSGIRNCKNTLQKLQIDDVFLGGGHWKVDMGRYEGGRGQKWPKIGDVVYGWPFNQIGFGKTRKGESNFTK